MTRLIADLTRTEQDRLWEDVYSVLVREAGAAEGFHREVFVLTQERRCCAEYRLSAGLGFGGKLRRTNDHGVDGLFVDCYPEDRTPARAEMIADTNAALVEVLARYGVTA